MHFKVLSEMLVPDGRVIVTTHANSKSKDATTAKFCTVMVRRISTKNQQLGFPYFHCYIVCSYCSLVCLIIKSG